MSDQTSSTVNRRGFLGTITRAAALSPLSMLSLDANPKENIPAETHVFLSKPYQHPVNAGSISIRWITAKPSYSWVEYGEDGKFDRKAHAVTDGMVNAFNRVHEVVIDGLQPGKKYSYRVVSKDITEFQPYKLTYGEVIMSDAYSFSTMNPSAKEVSWIVLNDIHDRPHSFGQLMSLNKDQHFDYVFLNGDMFDYQTDEQQLIDHLLTPCTEHFASNKPMLFVRGNHETRGRFARNLPGYFSNPGGQYFAYQWGPVYAIALDTGEDKADETPVYAGIVDFDNYRRKQAVWLEKIMQEKAYKKAKYRVVMMHIPPYYSGDWHGTMHCREVFSHLFDKYKVDLVISGHTHTYGVHPPVAGTHNYPIVIGGGPTEGKRTLTRVTADEKVLRITMIRDDGNEVGSYTINAKG